MTKKAKTVHIDIYPEDREKIGILAQKKETHADFVKKLIGTFLIAHPHYTERLKQ